MHTIIHIASAENKIAMLQTSLLISQVWWEGTIRRYLRFPMWNLRVSKRHDSDQRLHIHIQYYFCHYVFCFRAPVTPFPIPLNICRCASRQLAAAALAVVSLNFQPSLSSPSPFHNIFCHTIITSTLIATVFVVDVVVCVNKISGDCVRDSFCSMDPNHCGTFFI